MGSWSWLKKNPLQIFVIQKIKIPKPETSPTSGYAQPIQTDLSQRQPDISSSIA